MTGSEGRNSVNGTLHADEGLTDGFYKVPCGEWFEEGNSENLPPCPPDLEGEEGN